MLEGQKVREKRKERKTKIDRKDRRKNLRFDEGLICFVASEVVLRIFLGGKEEQRKWNYLFLGEGVREKTPEE